ncbi:MAG: ATP-dependent DNA helicase, partial [Patescibacteria group bacterium]
ILTLITKFTEMSSRQSLFKSLVEFLQDSGYLRYLNGTENQENRQALSDLTQFANKIKNFAQNNPSSSLSDFLQLLEMEMTAGESGLLAFDPDIGPDMVKLMTVHGSKGLEFPYVFVCGMIERKFPSDNRSENIPMPEIFVKEKNSANNSHLEEERRLFYVAVTRAKKGLFFTWAKNYGTERDRKPSKFLLEAGFTDFDNFIAVSTNLWSSIGDNQKKEVGAKPIIPESYSISDMELFEKCPLQYKYRKIIKIPTFGSGVLTFGNTMHAVLQKFVSEFVSLGSISQTDLFGDLAKSTKPDEKRLWQIYDECWQDDWYKSEGEKKVFKQKGREILQRFYRDFTKENPVVKFLELPFKIKINGNLFKGRIDRLDEKDGLFEIIDYKTGRPKEKLTAEDKRQLVFYQLVAEEVLQVQLKGLSYYYLENGTKMEFLATKKDKEKLIETVNENIEQIKNNQFSPKPSEFSCGFCDYKNICEFRKF